MTVRLSPLKRQLVASDVKSKGKFNNDEDVRWQGRSQINRRQVHEHPETERLIFRLFHYSPFTWNNQLKPDNRESIAKPLSGNSALKNLHRRSVEGRTLGNW